MQVADCLPVALATRDQVAMLHCGWRGLAGGIIARALERFDEPPAAAIGPGIGKCCYEVGEEVAAELGRSGETHLDLRAIAREQLEAARPRVLEVDLCTSCHPELFFSHRRDNGVTGRQAGRGGARWRLTGCGPTSSGCARRSAPTSRCSPPSSTSTPPTCPRWPRAA